MNSDILYKKNYLVNVVARVDFAVPIEGLDEQLPSELNKAALTNFPIAEPQMAVERKVQLSVEKIKQKKSEFMQWRFFGKDRKKSITFIPTAIFVEYTQYQSYTIMRQEFLAILAEFFRIYNSAVCTRLGLRYINNLTFGEGDPLVWNDYLNPQMLSTLDLYPERKFISRAFQNLELNFGDFSLRYQFGMHNPDYPAPIKQKSFILDFDAYYQGPQEYSEIGTNLDRYHEQIQGMFELSITPRLREVMNA